MKKIEAAEGRLPRAGAGRGIPSATSGTGPRNGPARWPELAACSAWLAGGPDVHGVVAGKRVRHYMNEARHARPGACPRVRGVRRVC